MVLGLFKYVRIRILQNKTSDADSLRRTWIHPHSSPVSDKEYHFVQWPPNALLYSALLPHFVQ